MLVKAAIPWEREADVPRRLSADRRGRLAASGARYKCQASVRVYTYPASIPVPKRL